MRYPKGSIALSGTKDYPLLRQVQHSGVITHNQLFEFSRLDYRVTTRNDFNKRVLRLVKHGLLIRGERSLANREAVYSLSRSGALELERSGDHFVHSSSGRPESRDRLRHHSLELNEVHLALKRTGSLVYWMPETEIRSRNDLTPYGYCKYYDAIVVVRLAGQDCKFAVEYERTPKASRHYRTIRERIERETRIAHLLYIVPNYDLMWFIMEELAGCSRPVYFGLFREFLQQTLALQVRQLRSPASLTLASALTQGNEAQPSGPLFPTHCD
jgi:hypothetical protein